MILTGNINPVHIYISPVIDTRAGPGYRYGGPYLWKAVSDAIIHTNVPLCMGHIDDTYLTYHYHWYHISLIIIIYHTCLHSCTNMYGLYT